MTRRNKNKKTTKRTGKRTGGGQMLGGTVPGMMRRVPGMKTRDVGKTVPGLGGRIHGMDKTTR